MTQESKSHRIDQITEVVLRATAGDDSVWLDTADTSDELAALCEATNTLFAAMREQREVLVKTQSALNKSEWSYRRFRENIPGMVYLFAMHPDGSYSFPYVSDASRQLFDIDPADLMRDATLITRMIHPDDRERFETSVQRSAATLTPWREELRHIVKGEMRWYDCMSSPELQPNGDIVWDGLILEITARKQAEAELLASEERYRRIIETTQEGVWMIDVNSQTSFVNQKMADMLGYTIAEMQGRSLFDFMDEEWREVARTNVERRRHGITEQHDFRFQRKDGSHVWTLVTTNPIFDGTGSYVGALAMISDISVRKRAEEALQETYAYLRTLIQASPLAIIAIDREGIVKLWNTAAERIFGWQEKEALGQFLPLVSENKRDEYLAIRERVLQGEAITNFETRLSRKDGSPIDVSVSLAPLGDSQARITGIMSVTVDITDRKQVEEALIKNAHILKESQSVARLGHYTFDATTGIWESSEILDAIFGIDASFARTVEGWLQIVHPDDRDKMAAYLRDDVLGARQPFDREYKIVRLADKQQRWVHGHGRLEFDEGGTPVRMLGTIQDISERKLLEEQLLQSQKMEAIGQLAGGVAHDFNNMLSVILGYIELIKEQLATDDPLLRDLSEIETAANRSRDIARQLLAFSRKQIISPRIVNLNTMFTDTQKTLSRLIGEDIDLCFIPQKHLGNVRLDPSQFDQILFNLAVNARDAMPNGGKLTIETTNVHLDEAYCQIHLDCRPGHYVVLSVSDDGVGMDKDTLSRIFEPFFTTKAVGKGTGLGLATVYGIVKQNNGFINVYSELGHGTTFKIYLPQILEKIAGGEKNKAVSLAANAETVLLVEDDDMVRRMTATMLKKLGYTVIVAEKPANAISICESKDKPIELLLTDVVMPEMSGMELRDKIKTIVPNIRVVFMSGYTTNIILHRGVLDEDVHFVQKPFTMHELSHKIHAAFADRR